MNAVTFNQFAQLMKKTKITGQTVRKAALKHKQLPTITSMERVGIDLDKVIGEWGDPASLLHFSTNGVKGVGPNTVKEFLEGAGYLQIGSKWYLTKEQIKAVKKHFSELKSDTPKVQPEFTYPKDLVSNEDLLKEIKSLKAQNKELEGFIKAINTKIGIIVGVLNLTSTDGVEQSNVVVSPKVQNQILTSRQ